MTVHTTYFSALAGDGNVDVDPAPDAHVVAVVRRPAGFVEDIVDRNVRCLAPPEQLLDAMKAVEEQADADGHDDPTAVAWNSVGFAEQYRDHIQRGALEPILGQLRRDERDADLWLACYERDPAHCHRRLLADELTRGRDDDPVHHPEPNVDDAGVPDARLDEFQTEGPA